MTENNRPLLIFKHYPKAAGGTLGKIIKQMYPKEISSKVFIKEIVESEKKKTQKFDPKKYYVLLNEGERVGSDYNKHGYVISTIREPCSHSVSLWCFGSTGKGGFAGTFWKKEPKWAKKAFGQDRPLYDSERDIKSYQTVFLARDGMAETSVRRFSSYFIEPTSSDKEIGNKEYHSPAVDCWIHVENFIEDSISCLKQFERQGGYVNWKASKVQTLLNAFEKSNEKQRLLYNKNGIKSPQAQHHSSCDTYYNDDTATLIERKNSLIYKLFGYQGCCSKKYSIQTNVTASFINVEREQHLLKEDHDIVTSAPSSGRNLLIFKNTRGISSPILEEVLKEIKPIEMSRDEFTQVVHHSEKPVKLANEKFVNFNDNESIISVDQNHGFVMSIIREPCSYYVSEFRSGSEGKGEVHDYWEKHSPEWTKAAYGQDGPGFDSSQDIDRFRDVWYSKNEGMIGSHFKQHYLQSGDVEKAPVDCWVRVEAFESTFVSCLQQFEQQGGEVKWDSPKLSKMVDAVKNKQLSAHDDNTLLCSKYFDDETAALVDKGQESFMYSMFGYDKCCGVVSNTADITPPLDLDEITKEQLIPVVDEELEVLVQENGVNPMMVGLGSSEIEEEMLLSKFEGRNSSFVAIVFAVSIALNLLAVVYFTRRNKKAYTVSSTTDTEAEEAEEAEEGKHLN